MFGKIKIRKADTEYSKWLRKDRKYTCERCGAYYADGKGLQVSHFYGRANEATRFLPENTDVMCAGCHQYFTANPAMYSAWKRAKMGEQKYKQLMVAANTYQKRDDTKILLFLKHIQKL